MTNRQLHMVSLVNLAVVIQPERWSYKESIRNALIGVREWISDCTRALSREGLHIW